MTKDYLSDIELNSSLLGKLLSTISDRKIRNFDNILCMDSVKIFFSDEELVSTVEMFLRNNLSIVKASNSMGVHRNTMVYRLEKVKKLLGLDIKEFEDAVTIQIILLANKLSKKKKRQVKMESKPITIQTLK